MYENEQKWQRAILASVNIGEFDTEQSLRELCELAKSADAEVVAEVTQNRDAYDKATCIGAGRLEEIKELCTELEADLIIFDHELTATQTRNPDYAYIRYFCTACKD